jgi:hypothetical protein
VFLASFGDMGNERALALEAIEQLPYDPLLRGKVTIEAVAWDEPGAGAPMLAAMTPQAGDCRGAPEALPVRHRHRRLWSRMGTPLPAEYCKTDGSAYRSGTEWEYLEAIEANRRTGKPEILVYRRTEPCLVAFGDRSPPAPAGPRLAGPLDQGARPLLEVLLDSDLAADGAQVAGQRVAAGSNCADTAERKILIAR